MGQTAIFFLKIFIAVEMSQGVRNKPREFPQIITFITQTATQSGRVIVNEYKKGYFLFLFNHTEKHNVCSAGIY